MDSFNKEDFSPSYEEEDLEANLPSDTTDAVSITANEDLDNNSILGVDSEDGGLGEFISSTQTTDNEDHSQSSRSDDSFLIKLANLTESEKFGDALSEPVAKLINNHINRDFANSSSSLKSMGDVKHASAVLDKFSKYPTPSNINNLLYCKVNDGVYKAMPAGVKKLNGELQLSEAALCKALTAQALVFEKLAALKKEANSSLNDKFNDIFSLLADSVEFSSFGRSKLNNSRRVQIMNSLNDNYKHLVHETKPGGGLLFGDCLDTAIKSVEQSNKLSKKLTSSSNQAKSAYNKTFLGRRFPHRGRGRGNSNLRWNPYDRRGTAQIYNNQSQYSQNQELTSIPQTQRSSKG